MFARAHTVALIGASGHLVDVQADVSSGSPGITIVGRADGMLGEGKDRARMAVANSGLKWPSTQRLTVLLAPADLPKAGTHYDLAMAVAVLAAVGELSPAPLERTVLIGELSLDGGLRPVPGILPMVLAAARQGVHRVIVPEPQAGEAALVPGVDVIGARSLAQVVAVLRNDEIPDAPPVPLASTESFLSWRGQDRLDEVDMADLHGLAEAKFAVEVAVAGGHHLHLSGSKGCGKTSLAERIHTVMPDLDPDIALELMALRSLAGRLDPSMGLPSRPPFTAPHHDASKAALVGGGSGKVSPGLISLAHGGVLFLDEFPLFRTDVIDALRDPMESGDITVSRGEQSVTLPARALVVVASNPCPCGNEGSARSLCQCRATEKREYQRRVRGPITDRLDVVRLIQPPAPGQDRPTGSSAEMRARIELARARQRRRFGARPWRLNSEVPHAELAASWALDPMSQTRLRAAVGIGAISGRGAVRIHRLAWTVADLRGLDYPGPDEVEVAMALRSGEPLPAVLFQGEEAR